MQKSQDSDSELGLPVICPWQEHRVTFTRTALGERTILIPTGRPVGNFSFCS